MGDIVDLNEFRKRKINKQKGIDTRNDVSRQVSRGMHPSQKLHPRSGELYEHLSTMSDSMIHNYGQLLGIIPNPVAITDMGGINYDDVRKSIVMHPDAQASLHEDGPVHP